MLCGPHPTNWPIDGMQRNQEGLNLLAAIAAAVQRILHQGHRLSGVRNMIGIACNLTFFLLPMTRTRIALSGEI